MRELYMVSESQNNMQELTICIYLWSIYNTKLKYIIVEEKYNSNFIEE